MEAWTFNRASKSVIVEDKCNDKYRQVRMCAALKLKKLNEKIPSEHTVYRMMEQIDTDHPKHRKSTR